MSVNGKSVKLSVLSPNMTEGTIVKWLKKEGESISANDALCEIKDNEDNVHELKLDIMEQESEATAILAKILIPEGESGVPVNKLIALTVDEGEDWEDVQIPILDQDQGLDRSGVMEIKMPSLSIGMTKGAILKWCKKEGDDLKTGETLFFMKIMNGVAANQYQDIKVDKRNNGILAKILVPEGESGVPVNKLIALAVKEGDNWENVQIPGLKTQSDKKTVMKPSTVVEIKNLERSFTMKQLTDLLKKYGDFDEKDLWVNTFKSHALVKFKNVEAAKDTIFSLNGVKWPPSNSRKLNVSSSCDTLFDEKVKGIKKDKTIKNDGWGGSKSDKTSGKPKNKESKIKFLKKKKKLTNKQKKILEKERKAAPKDKEPSKEPPKPKEPSKKDFFFVMPMASLDECKKKFM